MTRSIDLEARSSQDATTLDTTIESIACKSCTREKNGDIDTETLNMRLSKGRDTQYDTHCSSMYPSENMQCKSTKSREGNLVPSST
jgi:hypothetical protein